MTNSNESSYLHISIVPQTEEFFKYRNELSSNQNNKRPQTQTKGIE